MTHSLRFAVAVLPNRPWDVLQQRCKVIEALDFDLIATGDHFVDWSNPASPWFEAWSLLAAIARQTERIRLAIYVNQIQDLSLEMASRIVELGFSEIDLYYPFLEARLPMFERIALDILPKLKEQM